MYALIGCHKDDHYFGILTNQKIHVAIECQILYICRLRLVRRVSRFQSLGFCSVNIEVTLQLLSMR